jgi:membrane-associated phospholipid phosphatase
MTTGAARPLAPRPPAIARLISIALHPFVMVAAMVAVGGSRQPAGAQPMGSALMIALASMVPVALLIVRQVRRGRWANVDASNVRERPILFVVTLAALAAGLAWLLVTNPGSFLVRGLLVTGAMVALSAALTRWVKVSLHLAFATMAATAMAAMRSPVGYLLLALVPVLAWSRVALGRHRWVEVVFGAGLGALAAGALFWF